MHWNKNGHLIISKNINHYINEKIKFILILLVFDLTLSNLIFKNTQYWSILNLEEKWWRVSSKDYHHKILPNIDQIEIGEEKFKKG